MEGQSAHHPGHPGRQTGAPGKGRRLWWDTESWYLQSRQHSAGEFLCRCPRGGCLSPGEGRGAPWSGRAGAGSPRGTQGHARGSSGPGSLALGQTTSRAAAARGRTNLGRAPSPGGPRVTGWGFGHYRVDLSQHCSLGKEAGLLRVHDNQIKVGLPGPGLQGSHEEHTTHMLSLETDADSTHRSSAGHHPQPARRQPRLSQALDR